MVRKYAKHYERTLHKFPDNSNQEELKDGLIKLSTNIDLGRLFFKNKLDGEYKINKPEVFRGRRVLILDVIVLYYDIFKQGIQTKIIEKNSQKS